MDTPRLPSRRKVLAGLLLVPPALLDLTGKSPGGERKVIEYLSKPNQELLQSIVSLAWGMYFSGDFQAATTSIDSWLEHASKAQQIAKGVTRDQLNATIIHMLQLSATSARDRGDLKRAEVVGVKALDLSKKIRNVDMLLASHHHLFRAYMQGNNWEPAKSHVDESLSLVAQHTSVSPAISGTIYVDAGEIYAMLARSERGLIGQALSYFDKAASIARISKNEVESEFIRFSLACVMNERANAEAWFHQRRESLNSIALAKKTMPVSNMRWTKDYLLSSASLHVNIEENVTGCYLDMLESIKIHRELSSTSNLNWMQRLHARCIQIEPGNKYRTLIETRLQELQQS